MFCIMFCYALVSLTYICNHMTYSCIYVYVYVSTLFIWCILMSLCNSVMSCLRFMFLVNLSFQDAGLGRVGHQQTVGGNFIPPKVLRTRPSWVGWLLMRPGHAVQPCFSYMQQFLKCRGTRWTMEMQTICQLGFTLVRQMSKKRRLQFWCSCDSFRAALF